MQVKFRLKKGNYKTYIISVKDGDGNPITNLTSASDVLFMVKINKTDTDIEAIINKSISSGITVNDPEIGDIKVPLSDTDTDVDPQDYFVALEIQWTTNVQEIDLKISSQVTDILEIFQDIIRG